MHPEDINHEIILTFFSNFYRFESALRKAGYFKDGRSSQTDWDRFLRAIESGFDPNVKPEQIGAFLTLLDSAHKQGYHRGIKGAVRDIVLVSEIIQKMGKDLTRGNILRRYTEEELTAITAAMLILSAWAELEPNVKRIWNTHVPKKS